LVARWRNGETSSKAEGRNAVKPPPALVILARHPEPGKVKSRLAASIGDAAAAALYRAFLLDLGRRLAAHPAWVLYWAFEPADAPFSAEIAGGAEAFAQAGGDLGERIADAIGRVLSAGHPTAVLIGSDIPHVSIATLEDAFRRLAAGAPLVLGPAEDGGYYLIGATSLPPVFRDIRWGGSGVLAETIAAARRAGIEPALVAADYDIDDTQDLLRLKAEILGGQIRDLEATERELERAPGLRYR
jgi:rSAM/selenodomain-associated transferase 1